MRGLRLCDQGEAAPQTHARLASHPVLCPIPCPVPCLTRVGPRPWASLSDKQVEDPSPDQTARHSPPRTARTWQVQRTSAVPLSGPERAAGRWKELCVVKKSKTSSPGWEGNGAASETGTLSSPTRSQRCLREERREPTEEVCACCLSFHYSDSLTESGLLGQQYCKYTFKGTLK